MRWVEDTGRQPACAAAEAANVAWCTLIPVSWICGAVSLCGNPSSNSRCATPPSIPPSTPAQPAHRARGIIYSAVKVACSGCPFHRDAAARYLKCSSNSCRKPTKSVRRRRTAPPVRGATIVTPLVDRAYAARPMLAASSAARCMLDDISFVTVLCSSTAAAVAVTYSLTF